MVQKLDLCWGKCQIILNQIIIVFYFYDTFFVKIRETSVIARRAISSFSLGLFFKVLFSQLICLIGDFVYSWYHQEIWLYQIFQYFPWNCFLFFCSCTSKILMRFCLSFMPSKKTMFVTFLQYNQVLCILMLLIYFCVKSFIVTTEINLALLYHLFSFKCFFSSLVQTVFIITTHFSSNTFLQSWIP